MMSDDALLNYLAEMTPAVRAAIRDATERDGAFFPGFDAYRATEMVELVRPDMPTIFTEKRLSKDGVRARLMLLARWDEIEQASRDPILEKLTCMAPFIDQSWDGTSTYSPSEKMIMRYFIAVADKENPARIRRMKEQAIGWIDESRRRWKAGFHANPIGTPLPRTEMQGHGS
ncbi:hypothetical protein [Sphingobium sp. HDIP04]|uniref:hypothetical protein n=1 Tax=Sphingobium sp. HDIP04 TaxID=428994 RepID=UPI0003876F0C|nr:hypothetical protein [Sphingobium sp. HDIP04]EQA97253.1 hypothetical protein L286_23290 [Sphingobium sp. HDIP04]